MPSDTLRTVSELALRKCLAQERAAYARHIGAASACRRMIRRVEGERARRAGKEVPDGS